MNKLVSLLGVILVAITLGACSSVTTSAIGAGTDRPGIMLAASGLDVTANMAAPGGYCSSGTAGDRTVWVVSDKPFRLALLGNSRAGNILSCGQTEWTQTGMGFMTQVSFPSSYASSFNSLRLVREDGRGWSDWNKDHGSNEMSYLRHSNVGRSDPACVGGRSWCAVRGL